MNDNILILDKIGEICGPLLHLSERKILINKIIFVKLIHNNFLNNILLLIKKLKICKLL